MSRANNGPRPLGPSPPRRCGSRSSLARSVHAWPTCLYYSPLPAVHAAAPGCASLLAVRPPTAPGPSPAFQALAHSAALSASALRLRTIALHYLLTHVCMPTARLHLNLPCLPPVALLRLPGVSEPALQASAVICGLICPSPSPWGQRVWGAAGAFRHSWRCRALAPSNSYDRHYHRVTEGH